MVNKDNEIDMNKNKLIEFMEKNNMSYKLLTCCGCDRICVDFDNEDITNKRHCCNSSITVQTGNKNICVLYPKEILYIAIENRKSVVYLSNRTLETNYSLTFWKNLLDFKIFAQPHYSYVVNLNYVDEVTDKFVKIKNADKEYMVYTSSRKIGAFKKAFLKFGER